MFKLHFLILAVLITINKLVKCDEDRNFLGHQINIRWRNLGNLTQFWLTANLSTSVVNDTSHAWISVGINTAHHMVTNFNAQV